MVTDVMARESDLILVMDSQQQQQIAAEYPLTRGKVFRLGETTKQNIHDPYRQSAEVFRSSLDLIASGSSAWVKRINSIRSSRARTK
jgi:protein-tyrosine phosphatase